MRDKIDELTEIWKEKVNLRNSYSFGEEDISLGKFAELFRKTYELIKTVQNDYIYKGVMPDAFDLLIYIELISCLARYTTYDNMVDESENKAFTVTALIAEELVHYATGGYVSSVFEGAEHYLCDSDEINQGLLIFCRDSYPFYNDEDWEHEDEVYKYNIYKANFDEISELAKQLM